MTPLHVHAVSTRRRRNVLDEVGLRVTDTLSAPRRVPASPLAAALFYIRRPIDQFQTLNAIIKQSITNFHRLLHTVFRNASLPGLPLCTIGFGGEYLRPRFVGPPVEAPPPRTPYTSPRLNTLNISLTREIQGRG